MLAGGVTWEALTIVWVVEFEDLLSTVQVRELAADGDDGGGDVGGRGAGVPVGLSGSSVAGVLLAGTVIGKTGKTFVDNVVAGLVTGGSGEETGAGEKVLRGERDTQ